MSPEQGEVRIGVVAHRALSEIDKIARGVNEAIDRIEKKFPGRTLVALSALAEGGDRLVAQQILKRHGAKLIATLPLGKRDYLTDFASAESRKEFLEMLGHAVEVIELSNAPSREAAYEAQGLYLLNHSDALLTIWDGRDAQGQGGTGNIVRRARSRHFPIAWVHAGNRLHGTEEPTSLGAEQGMVTFENF